jgi:hypothetical protein
MPTKKLKKKMFRLKLIVGGPFHWVNLTNYTKGRDEYSLFIQCNIVLCHIFT